MALGELLVSAIDAPPSGARVGSDTTPVSGRPPAIEARPIENANWPIVKAALRATPEYDAVIVADVGVAGAPMSTWNVWTVLPNGTSKDAGTVAEGELLASATDSPPGGAGAVNVTVPWTGTPDIDTTLERKMLWRADTVTTVVTSVAVWLVPVYVAVMTLDAATLVVVIGKDRLLEPAGIVTLAGTVTVVVLLASVTTAPSVGASPVSVSTPVTEVPPNTDVVDSTMLASATTVGAVVVVVSAHPETTKAATTATPAGRRQTERKWLRFTTPIVSPNTRPECDRTMARP